MLSCTRFSTCRAGLARQKNKDGWWSAPGVQRLAVVRLVFSDCVTPVGSGCATQALHPVQTRVLFSCAFSWAEVAECFILLVPLHEFFFGLIALAVSCSKSLNLNEQNPEWTNPKWTKPWIVQNHEWTKSGIGEWYPELDKIPNKQNHESDKVLNRQNFEWPEF